MLNFSVLLVIAQLVFQFSIEFVSSSLPESQEFRFKNLSHCSHKQKGPKFAKMGTQSIPGSDLKEKDPY